jgi:hypothetical protein
MTYKLPAAFFAYPSQPPMLGETLRSAIAQINASHVVNIRTWEDCRIGGKFIIGEICKAIDDSKLLLADLTGLNPNVLFEVGYGIARNKRIWPLLDTSIGGNDFSDLRTLSTVGYASYVGSPDIIKAYFKDSPHEDAAETILNSSIMPGLVMGQTPTLLYLKSQHETDASVQITRRLETIPMRLMVDDPQETPFQTLTWYGQQVYNSAGVVCHLTNPARAGARIRNARYALVAGIAFGLAKEVIILSEGDYVAPLDYRDILKQYATAAAAHRHVDSWLQPIEDNWREEFANRQQYSASLRLATELRGLNLGEYIAEQEGERLVDGYFIETAAYREALSGLHTVFVGRKGTGKSANFLQLGARLNSDARNIVSVIKPVSYELESILRILGTLKDRDRKVYVIEGLWKFLLYSDLACALHVKISNKVPQARTDAENKYMAFFEKKKAILSGDFSARLERCIDSLENQTGASATARSTEEYRETISHSLHTTLLSELRTALLGALRRGARLAILIDNLDKAWDRQSDLRSLAEFLLGLLSAADKIRQDIKNKLPDTEISLAVFLRADIFEKIQEVAREPDKINFVRLTWGDPELLYKLISERYSAAIEDQVPPDAIWNRFFCPTIDGVPTKHALTNASLPRPRDFLYLVKSSIATAVNRGHSRVEAEDVREALKAYSEFAHGILLIEDNSQEGALAKVLYEFVGAPSRLTHDEVVKRIITAGVADADAERVLTQLCALSFFGLEVADGEFRFPDSAAELKKVAVLSRKLCDERKAKPVYRIHNAFQPFLETVS